MQKANRPNIELVLAVLARVGRVEIRKIYTLPSCIASTRIVIDVLGRYGIHSEPRAVTTRVSKAGGGGCFIGSVERHTRGLWKGTTAAHLIAVIPGKNLLIDASIDQVNQPAHGLQVPCPFIAQVSNGFMARRERSYFFIDDYALIYEQDRLPRQIRQTPDWRSRFYNRPVVESICAHIESARTVSDEEFIRRIRRIHPRTRHKH
jgi:hypothetical protein